MSFIVGIIFLHWSDHQTAVRMVESFIKSLTTKRFSRHTCAAYQTDLTQFSEFLVTHYETSDPAAATYVMVRAWIVQLVEEGVDAASVNRKIACLRSYFKYLLRQNVITKDPMLKIRLLKPRKKLPAFVKESEVHKVLDHQEFADTLDGARTHAVLELFYSTGIRLSELLGLQDQDINFSAHTVRVLGKRNKERIVPFPESIVPALTTYREIRNREITEREADYFFVTNKGKACYPMLIQRMVKVYLIKTAAEKQSPHVLRHTYATHLLNKGADLNAVKELLGHTSLAATQVYTHNSMEKLKRVFEQAHPKA